MSKPPLYPGWLTSRRIFRPLTVFMAGGFFFTLIEPLTARSAHRASMPGTSTVAGLPLPAGHGSWPSCCSGRRAWPGPPGWRQNAGLLIMPLATAVSISLLLAANVLADKAGLSAGHVRLLGIPVLWGCILIQFVLTDWLSAKPTKLAQNVATEADRASLN